MPQIYSHEARPGVDAYLTLAEMAGKRFSGKLVRTAGSIDVASRTLRVEVDLDNRNHELMPGAYAQVHLRLAEGVPTQLVPVSALIFRADGLRIATVGPGNHARLSTIVPGRDFGNEIEVLGGLPPGRQTGRQSARFLWSTARRCGSRRRGRRKRAGRRGAGREQKRAGSESWRRAINDRRRWHEVPNRQLRGKLARRASSDV